MLVQPLHSIRLLLAGLTILSLAPAAILSAQDKKKEPKVDSLVVTVNRSRQETLDALVAAFQSNRLQVTNTTSSMVEADLGKKAGTFAVFERKVRALILGSAGATTKVMLVGDETQYTEGSNPRSYRIDSKAKSEGGKIWKKMVAVAQRLESESPAVAASPPQPQAVPGADQARDTAAPGASAVPDPSATLPQAEAQPTAWRIDDVPPGTNWVANGQNKTYYPVGCPVTAKIPAADRFFYGNETTLQTAGFKRAEEC